MGIFSSVCGSAPKAGSTPTEFESLPQEAQDALLQLLSGGQELAADASAFAPILGVGGDEQFLLNQLQGRETALPQFNLGQRGIESLDLSQDLLSRIGPALTQGLDFAAQGATPLTSGEISSSIGDFLNPFLDQVVASQIADIEQSGAERRSVLNTQFDSAFGGTRQAVENASLTEDILRTVGAESGKTRAAGFSNAASLALNRLQSERSNFLQAAGINIAGAGVASSAGIAAGQLGGQQIDQRLDIADFRRNELESRLAASTALSQPFRQFEQEQQDIPFEQLALIQSILGSFPTGGGGTTGVAEDSGLFGRILGPISGFSGGGKKK